jgi:hypothetical protein
MFSAAFLIFDKAVRFFNLEKILIIVQLSAPISLMSIIQRLFYVAHIA